MIIELIYEKDGSEIVSVPLEKDCFKIGRLKDNDLSFENDLKISSSHAMITKADNGYFIEDLGSTNKTYVNDKAIINKTVLKNKDKIKIGDVNFIFSIKPISSNITNIKIESDRSARLKTKIPSSAITGIMPSSRKADSNKNATLLPSKEISLSSDEKNIKVGRAKLPSGTEAGILTPALTGIMPPSGIKEEKNNFTVFSSQRTSMSSYSPTICSLKNNGAENEKHIKPGKEYTKKQRARISLQKYAVTILSIILTGIFASYYYFIVLKGKDEVKGHFDRGEEYFEDKKYEKAIQEFDKTLELDEGYSEAFRGLARSYKALFNYDKAIYNYKKLVNLENPDSDDCEICNYIGDIYLLDNNYKEAEKWYRAVEAVNSMKNLNGEKIDSRAEKIAHIYSDALAGLARLDVINYRYEDAGSKYKKALEINDKNLNALIGLGQLKMKVGNYEDGIHYLSLARGADPDNVEALLGIAELYTYKEEYEKSFEEYENIIKNHPKIIEAYTGKAEVCRLEGKYSDGLAVLKEAEEISSQNPSIYITRARIFCDEEKYDEALEEADLALSIHKNSLPAISLKGDIYAKQGKINLSIKFYEGVLEKSPEDFWASKGLGKVYLSSEKEDRYDKAIKYLEKARDIKIPEDIDFEGTDNEKTDFTFNKEEVKEVYTLLGDAYYGKENYNSAVKNYEKAFALDNKDKDICCKIGNIYKEKGEKDEAFRWYTIALEIDPECKQAKEALNILSNSNV